MKRKTFLPLKIAVLRANGRAGRLIVEEALDRGLDVTVVVDEAVGGGACKSGFLW